MSAYTDNLLFDEGFYLSSYPEVVLSIQEGVYKSGLDHWEKHGEDHCYIPNKHFNESNYLLSNPHLAFEANKTENTCILHHWLKYNDLIVTLAEYSDKGHSLNNSEIQYLENNLSNDNSLEKIEEILFKLN